jgi:hypothetical protein
MPNKLLSCSKVEICYLGNGLLSLSMELLQTRLDLTNRLLESANSPPPEPSNFVTIFESEFLTMIPEKFGTNRVVISNTFVIGVRFDKRMVPGLKMPVYNFGSFSR